MDKLIKKGMNVLPVILILFLLNQKSEAYTNVSIILTTNNIEQGLTPTWMNNGTNDFIGGSGCRSITNSRYILLNIDNAFAFSNMNMDYSYKISLQYYDNGNNRIIFKYDDHSPGSFKEFRSFSRQNTLTWLEHSWTLQDAFFRDGMWDGDFGFQCVDPGDRVYIRRVIVEKIPRTDPEKIEIIFATNFIEDGLLVAAKNSPVTNGFIGGLSCIKMNKLVAADDYRVILGVLDFFSLTNSRTNIVFKISAVYFDNGFEKLSLLYDARSGAWKKHPEMVARQNSLKWKTKVWYVTDAYFGNRMWSGDLGFECSELNDSVYIRSVSIEKISLQDLSGDYIRLQAWNNLGTGVYNTIKVQVMNTNNDPALDWNGFVTVTVPDSLFLTPGTTVPVNQGYGEFRIMSLEPGKYPVTVSGPGFASWTASLDFKLKYTNSEVFSITLGTNSAGYGFGGFADNNDGVPVLIDGVECLKIAPGSVNVRDRCLVLNLDDTLIYNVSYDGGIYALEMEFWDNSTENILVEYDYLQTKGGDDWMRSLYPVVRKNRGTWVKRTAWLPGARFKNGVWGGDIRISAEGDQDIYIRNVTLYKMNYLPLPVKNSSMNIYLDRAVVIFPDQFMTRDLCLIQSRLYALNKDLEKAMNNIPYLNDLQPEYAVHLSLFDDNGLLPENFRFPKGFDLQINKEDQTGSALFQYNEERKEWERGGGTDDLKANLYSAHLVNFTTCALFGYIPVEPFKVTIKPNPFSPNGDNINDYQYFTVRPDKPSPIKIEIFTLSGKKIRDLEKVESTSGETFVWDGYSNNNKLMPVGTYIYQVIYDNGDKVYNGLCVLVK